MKILMVIDFTQWSHTIIGSIAFLGGIIALVTKKGSRFHIIGGRVFFFGMLYASLSIVKFMIEEFRPLAILLSVATIYCMLTSISALRHKRKYSKLIDTILIIFPIILFAFATFQLILILSKISLGTLARLLFSFTFALMVFRDFKRLKSNDKNHLFFIKRHAFRMILAFGFAVMAVLRIAVKFDFIDLEFSVAIPMLIALISAFYVEKKIEKLL
ncbi:hypothetical protein [uncultured Psychroserpens sp.]|uniref:hypothetical protein n=1 Tax=uncultured Psychroserpens sp. TaxID=255436 RepID=UPI0026159ACD|nr:hypothetical protein [uncultured Psychroserpens sp.]